MKQTNRRLISLILTLCMVLSLLPMSALANTGDVHTVTLALTGLTSDLANNATTAEVTEGSNGATFETTLTVSEGYTLPTSISVGGNALEGVTENASSGSYYNKNTGAVHIEGITADVTITAAGAAAVVTRTVTLNLTGITVGQTDADAAAAGVQILVNEGGSLDVTLTPSSGYALPTSVTVDGATLAAAATEEHDASANYYAPNENALHLAGVTSDVAVTVSGVIQPRYVVSLYPGNSISDHEAGETGVNFNVVLSLTNYTAEIANFGDVQFYDITIDYGAGLTYNSATPATSPYGTISVDTANHTITLRRLDASTNADALNGDDVRRLITLGSVHFDLPSAEYVDDNGIQGVYVNNPTVSSASTITNPGAQSSVHPASGGTKLNVRHTKLTIPAFDHATVSYKINAADTYTDIAKGASAADIYVPYNARPTFKITTDPGYELVRAGVHYYNNAAGVSQIYSSSTYDSSANTSAPIDQVSPYEVTANVSMYMDSTLNLTIYEATNTVTYMPGYGENPTALGTGTYKLSAASLTTRTAPTREGYIFQNWKVTSAGKHYDTAQNQTAYFAADNTYGANAAVVLDNAYGDVTLTAQWTASEQTNSYSDGVTQKAPASGASPVTDQSVTVTVTPPTGKQLTDLSIKDAGNNAVNYTPAVSPTAGPADFTFTQPASGVTVTPTFSDIGYAVTYNTDGGSEVTAGTYGISTTTFILPAAPAKQGYTFAGWKVTSAALGGTGFTQDATTAADAASMALSGAYGNVELTAQWTAAAHSNTLPNGVTTAPANPATGAEVVITVPDKTGYTVAAPTVTQQDGKSTAVAVSDSGDEDIHTWKYSQPAYDVTVTPNYTANGYAVTLNANNGTGGTASLTVTYDSAAVGAITNPTREGYTFAGWYTTADNTGSKVLTDANAFAGAVDGYTGTENSVTVWKIANNDTTLYAHWAGEAQTNAALPTGVTSGDNSYTNAHTGDTVSLTITPGEGYYLSALTIAKADGTGTVTPVTAPDLTEAQGTSQTITYVQPGCGVTVTPVFSGRTYLITMKDTSTYTYTGSNTFTVTYGSNTIYGGPDTISTDGTGYYDVQKGMLTVNGNNTNEDVVIKYTTTEGGVNSYTLAAVTPEYDASKYVSKAGIWKYAGDVSVAPITKAETYTAQFVTNGGTAIADTSFEYGKHFMGSKTISTRAGYTLEGWYLNKGLTAKVSNGSNSSQNTNIYWLPGASYEGDAYTTVADNYGFSYWNRDLGENGVATITFYAKWTPVTQKNNTLPTGVTAVDSTNSTNTWPNIPTGDTVTVTVPDKTAYTPSGLTLTLSNSSLAAPDVTSAGDDDIHTWSFVQPGCAVTIAPAYTPTSYTLTYVYGNGSADTAGAYNTESGTVTFPAAPTRTGYTFAGWKVTAAATAGAFSTADAVLTGTSVSLGTAGSSYGDATLTAQWTGNKSNANLYLYGSDTTPYLTFKVTYGELVTATGYTKPTRTGYTLRGWYPDTNGTNLILDANGTINKPAYGWADSDGKFNMAVAANSEIPLYAIWDINSYTNTLGEGVTFGSNPASYGQTVTVTVADKTGYTITGISGVTATATGSNTWTFEQPDQAVTVSAVYTAASYTVTFNNNDGTSTTSTQAVTYNTAFTAPTAPNRTGYTFAGWYTKADGTGVQVFTDANSVVPSVSGITDGSGNYIVAGGTSLYAHWTGNTQTNTLPADNTVTQTGTTRSGESASFTVTPPTGKMIKTLTVTNKTDSSNVTYSPTTFNEDGGAQTFTYTQPASGVTVAVSYENINYAVTYSVPNGVTVTGGDKSFTVDSRSLALPAEPTRTGYTFDGWTISRAAGSTGNVNGSSAGIDIPANAGSIQISSATGNLTLTAKWLATSNLLTVNTSDANAKATGTATFVAGDGIHAGSGADAGKYFIKADANANFTLTPAAGYKIVSVSYAATDGTGSGTTVEAANGTYTIPASACVVPLTLSVTTKIDTTKITADAAIVTKDGAQTFQTYSQYSGSKSLVLFNVSDTNVAGIALSNGVSVYKTSAYSGYQYAALLDLTGVTDKSEDGLNTYLQSLLMTKATANSALDYNKNVNGKGSFTIDDVSVEYDYTSRSALGWVPYDAYLIIGDIAGNGSSSADRVLDAYDVAAFVNAYKA